MEATCDELVAAVATYHCLQTRSVRRVYSVRALRPDDLPAVQEINASTYGGHDYVESCFPGWLQREGGTAWTAAVDGEHGGLAGLEVLSLYDGGRTGWLEALRVLPKCRGRGVALALQSHLVQRARELGFLCVRFTTAVGNVPSRRLGAKCGLQEVASWGILMPRRRVALRDFAARVAGLQARLVKGGRGPLLVPEALSEGAAAALAGYAVKAREPYLLQCNWKCFDFTLENVEALLAAGEHEEPLVLPEERGAGIGSFSWAFRQRDALGLSAFVTVYAPSLMQALAHASRQLQLAAEAGVERLMLMYPPSLEPELHRRGLAERSATALDGDAPVAKRVLLFERRL